MPRTPLEAYAFDARFGKRSVFILDPRLPSPWPHRTRTLILSHTSTFWQIFADLVFFLCKAFRISLLFKILEILYLAEAIS